MLAAPCPKPSAMHLEKPTSQGLMYVHELWYELSPMLGRHTPRHRDRDLKLWRASSRTYTHSCGSDGHQVRAREPLSAGRAAWSRISAKHVVAALLLLCSDGGDDDAKLSPVILCSPSCGAWTVCLTPLLRSVYAGNLSWSVTDRDLHDVRASCSSNLPHHGDRECASVPLAAAQELSSDQSLRLVLRSLCS